MIILDSTGIRQWLASNRPYETGVKLYAAHGHDALLKRLFAEGWSTFKEQRLAEALEGLAEALELVENAIPDTKTIADGVEEVLVVPATNLTQLEYLVDELSEEKEELQEQVYELEDSVYDLEKDNEKLSEENKRFGSKAMATPKGWPPVMDATVQAMYDEWLPLFKERKDLQARILEVAKAGETDEVKQQEAGKMAHRILDLREACIALYKRRNAYIATGELPPAEEPLPNLVTDPRRHPKCLANHQRYLREYKAKLQKAVPEDVDRVQANVNLQQRYVDHYKKLLS